MKLLLKKLGVLAVAGVLTACLVGCDTKEVAATVNGAPIYEEDVTGMIEAYRQESGLTTQGTWASYLIENEITAEDIRTTTINSLAERELVIAGAKEKKVAPTDEEVKVLVEQTKTKYVTTEAWENYLTQAGLTENGFESYVRYRLSKKALRNALVSEYNPEEKELLLHAEFFANAYDGAKKSSHILFSTNNKQIAQDVLERLQEGSLTFKYAVAQYSIDSETASDGGNRGWNVGDSFSTAYESALADLTKNQISDLVEDDEGLHIILCTDIYSAPDEITDFSQIPEEAQKSIEASLLAVAQNDAYEKWLEEYSSKAVISINDMPEGLSYDVSLD